MAESADEARVDELREQLRALGYLDAGVDRFVLAPARASRGPAAIALLASLRTGIIAALLLGPAAAVGVGGRLPGLVTGPRDAVVIAIYMGALFGSAIAMAAFAASLVVSKIAGDSVARRARPVALWAGGLVAVSSLAYLTLWWQTANAGLGWSAPVWTAFALAVAVAISLLVGHAVTVTAHAVILSGRHDDSLPAGRRGALSWNVSLLAGVLAFGGASALLVITAPAASAPSDAADLTVVSSGLRVRLLAIDGVDPAVLDELAREGRLPALSAVFAAARIRLVAEPTRDPARVWTTIATGQPAERHGVGGIETRRVLGLEGRVPSGPASTLGTALRSTTDLVRLTSPAITSGSERREKTLWEIASEAGLRTAVVNWWATWPAPAGDGPDGPIVLSDRATLRLERGGPLDAEISPASLYEPLLRGWPTLRDEANRQATAALAALPFDDRIRAILQRSAVLDAMQLLLARDVSARPHDLMAVYLPGLDIAQHALLTGEAAALAPSAVSARLDALRAYYVCLDLLLAGNLVPSATELVVVITEPGRVGAAADGLMGLSGRVARQGRAEAARPADVAPTILHALGVPISRDLAGTTLTRLLSEEFLKKHPVRHVERYGPVASARRARTGQSLDQEMVDRLRSLGYVR